MKYCGFDLGKKSSQFCVMNEAREIVREKRVSSTESALRGAFDCREKMKIVIEASTKAFWVGDLLESLGHEVIVVDPRRTKAIGSSQIKHDKLDARVLATLCAADVLAPVHRPSQAMRFDRIPLVVRDALVRSRTQLINAVRSILDSEGIAVRAASTDAFTTLVRELPDGLPEPIAAAIEPALAAIDALNTSIADADEAVATVANTDPVMKRLQTVDGVGPIVAATYVQAVRDAKRFRSGRQVGAYLGLIPSLYQSGDTHRKGRITKQGNRQARYALTMAAKSLMRTKRSSALKTWALAIAERQGRKKAIVALARKLAGVLWSMWKKQRDYAPSLGMSTAQ
jgi:transposase